MAEEFGGRSRRIAFCSLALMALVTVSCSRSRPFDRTARRRVPLPPPVVQFEPEPGTEVAIDLEPAPMPDRSRPGAAYGPAPRMSVVPPGATGHAVDMRYPALRHPHVRPIPVVPRSSLGPKLVSPIQPSGDESPVSLPPTPPNAATIKNGKSAAAPADSTTKSAAPRYSMTTEPDVATGAPVSTLEAIRALKDEGFNTVLNLLPEDQADRAEAFEVTRAGMEYISMPITPKAINKESLDKFNRIIAESKRPIYIHDSTGSVTGAMWYLNRIVAAKLPEDAARRQAAKAGLKEPGNDDLSTELWLAIARVLSEN